MGIGLPRISELAFANISASARITQALKVNDMGTAQRVAASAAMMSGQFQKQSLNQQSVKASERQIDLWA